MPKMRYQEFFKKPYIDEGCALFFRTKEESKFHLFIPLETIPAIVGDQDEVDYGYTTMAINGTIAGRKSTASAEEDFYWIEDYTNRLKEYSGQELDFLVILPDYQGYFFRGTITYSYNEIANNEVVTGTFTITPSWVDEFHTEDVREFIMDTAVFSNLLETEIKLDATTDNVKGKEYPVTLYPTSANVGITYHSKAYQNLEESDIVEATYAEGKITIKAKAKGFDTIKFHTSAEGYGSWDTYVKIEVIQSGE